MNISIDLPDKFLEEETRNDYTISKEMKKIWAIQIDMMVKVLEVCKKHNLKIFVDGGTILGTIRHGGYIPWDDDIDLIMLRDDYNKLLEIGPKEFEYPYFFQTEETDHGSSRGHIQIRNSETTGMLNWEKDYNFKFNQGIFIDVFPLDSYPNDEEKRKKFIRKLCFKKNLVFYYRTIVIASNKNLKGKKKIINNFFHYLFYIPNKLMKNKNIFEKSFDKYVQKYNNAKECDHVTGLALKPDRTNALYLKEWFDNIEYKKFEFLEVPVPKEYEKVLIEEYGNWQKIVRGNNTHGGVIFDTEKSYKEYLGI